MSELKLMNYSDFVGNKTCSEYNFVSGLELKSSSGTALDRHISMIDVIKGVIIDQFEIGEVTADLLSEGIESNYGLSETDEAMAEKEAALIRRYLNSENADIKAKRLLAYPEMVEVDCLNDIKILYKPDTVKVKDNVVTSAVYHAGSSQGKINQRTGMVEGKRANMEMWFKIFLAMLYSKQYAETCGKFQPGQHVRIVGAHYFMKKTTDKAGMLPDRDFFSGSGNNVITMEEEYVVGAPLQPSEQIQAMHKYMEQCLVGFKCSGEDCAYCVSRTICNFQKPPIKQAKKEVKERKKMAPTEEQQKAIDARDGLFKLLATAGSGKTETVTERFVVLVQELMSEGLKLKDALSKILMLSFTENAVGELKDRILSKLYASIAFCCSSVGAIFFLSLTSFFA
ncbi:MAG: UvrD-helicase domain-containing protein, partial [Lachnospiraceae bacterium]|nr:UvrD-helicase domain-containing protein [Lachnospiraceae bacterium]